MPNLVLFTVETNDLPKLESQMEEIGKICSWSIACMDVLNKLDYFWTIQIDLCK